MSIELDYILCYNCFIFGLNNTHSYKVKYVFPYLFPPVRKECAIIKKGENKMKTVSLLEQYKLSLKILRVAMPVIAALLLFVGIVLCVTLSRVFWVGLIVVAIGISTFGLFLLIKRFLVKMIKYIENDAYDIR